MRGGFKLSIAIVIIGILIIIIGVTIITIGVIFVIVFFHISTSIKFY